MIVVITGAYQNAGDHLIGDRARRLLAAHVDSDILNIDRKSITDATYEVFNRADLVLLTGGPAYQPRIYPTIYPLELDRIQRPVIPFGLGWKATLDASPESFKFAPDALDFVHRLHVDRNVYSSARDQLTVDMLQANGVPNVRMTGCPAWYDEPHLDMDLDFREKVRHLVLTMPAAEHEQVRGLIDYISAEFPRAEKFLAYQAGYKPPAAAANPDLAKWLRNTAFYGMRRGFRPVSLKSDLTRFKAILSITDLHIGYRVHAHLYSLSIRKPSVLIAEDARGQGQMQVLNSPLRTALQPIVEIAESLDRFMSSGAQESAAAIESMRTTYPVMMDFFAQLNRMRSS